MAQGALAALAGGGAAPDGASLRLAGVDDARLYAPVAPGDRLRVEAEVEGRFAALAKVACRLLRDDELVAEAKLLLAGDWAGA
jgi:3-hydroxymyristoyl/3-hydroxydecanoyl-(acyl carrier protein) dehydratase